MNVTEIAKPEPQRDRHGRYLIAGEAHTRATTITKTLSDNYGLTNWKLRQVAHGIGLRPDLQALAATTNPDTGKKALDRVCQDALDAASSSSGANIGTALHSATENVDQGQPCPPLPNDLNQRVDLYTKTIGTAGIVFPAEHIEQILTIPDWNGDGSAPPIAGTADRVAVLADGRRVIADLKTGKSLDYSWGEIAMQLAIYANHTHTYDPATDRLGPAIPDLDTTQGLIIHLPSTGPITCQLHMVDLVAGHEAVDYALWVRNWRKQSGLAEPYRPNRTSPTNRGGTHGSADWLRERIAQLAGNPAAVNMLIQLWPPDIPKPLPQQLPATLTDQMDTVLTRVEASAEIPFGENRPGKTTTKTTKKETK